MTLRELYDRIREVLPEVDARYVLNKRAGVTAADLIVAPDSGVPEGAVGLVMRDLERFQTGEPLSRIYEERAFWGMDFVLSPATLDPRIDTEVLIEAVLQRFKDRSPLRILDLGTGSGCILVTLLSLFPQAYGVGVDLSPAALQIARSNAQRHGVDARAGFVCADWGGALEGLFDLVVSNPPYIESDVILDLDENVRKFDPILALDGGQDGLQAYKRIFSDLNRLLDEGGFCFLEIGFDQEEKLTRLIKESRFLLKSVHADSAGHPRVVEIFSAK